MLRPVLAAFVLALLLALPAGAEEWADKMFSSRVHDFGNVARGAKAVFRFDLKNIYEEDVHIESVTSSCSCTSPQISKHDLKTFETGSIVAELNTRDHLGHKSATINVKLSKPFPATVQLNVSANIRGDVVLTPGIVDLGVVDHGTGVEKKISASFAGRDNWKIVDAKTVNPHFQVEVIDAGRGRGKVNYEIVVRLTKDAPVGYIKDQLILVTNDPQANELPVDIEGRVVSEITVSPASLFLGIVQPGQKVTKQLVVRGRKPFKIVEVDCEDDAFEVKPSGVAKVVHLVPVVFTAGDTAGKITRQISLKTDQGADIAPSFTAFAQVVAAGEKTKPHKKPADDEKADHGKRDEDDAEEEAEQAPAASTSKAPKRLKIETHEADDTVDETDDAGEAK